MLIACDVSDVATGLATVLAAVVLLIREFRRESSGGIPPGAESDPT